VAAPQDGENSWCELIFVLDIV